MNNFSEYMYAFIKNGRVINVAVFAGRDENLANLVARDCEADHVVDCHEAGVVPSVYWSWDGEVFAPPTDEYLIEIGVMEPVKPEVTDEQST